MWLFCAGVINTGDASEDISLSIADITNGSEREVQGRQAGQQQRWNHPSNIEAVMLGLSSSYLPPSPPKRSISHRNQSAEPLTLQVLSFPSQEFRI